MEKGRKWNSFSRVFDLKTRSISKELTISLILIIILFEGISLAVIYKRQSRSLLQALNKKADDYAVNLGQVLTVPIWDYDDEQISKIGAGYVRYDVVDEIHITDQFGKTLFKSREIKGVKNRIMRTTDVVYKEQIIGRVKLYLSLEAYKMDLARLRNVILLILTGSLIVIFITTGVLLRVFMRKPLSHLQKGINRVSEGDYSYKFDEIYHSELSGIANRFSEMATEIQAREHSLLLINKELKQEIDERKRAEERIKESEAKSRTLLDAMPDLVFQFDRDGTCLDFKGPTKYLYAPPESFLGKNVTEVLPTEISLLFKENLTKALNRRQIRIFEYELPIKDKSTYFECRMLAVSDDVIMAITRNITESKQAANDKSRLEEQLQQAHKMESIGTLAGGIAHDFNNIIGIILGNTELAMDDVPEWNPAKYNLEEIHTASLRAKDVVRQLLSFARKTTLEKKPTNIIPIVKESLKLLRSSIPTSIEIRQNIPKDIDTIVADPTQINQVIINLCTNADHSMPDGGIIVVTLKNVELDEDTAAQHPGLIPGCYVNLTVSDTGQGISQEDIDRIFDPYFTTKEVGKGTGMGLSVVHGIIKSHGGAISVDSELGKGTTFIVLFPVIEKQAVVEAETDEELPTGNERILFVDDEESMVYVGRYRLERLGYQVEAQTSPVQALKLFQANPDQFDLVITDMTMPQMTGDILIKEIFKIRPDMPTILCTGFHEKIDEERSKELGISAYIEKPLDRRDLAKLVRKVLDEK